jgi:Leucine-rich repeat (LRR) protein
MKKTPLLMLALLPVLLTLAACGRDEVVIKPVLAPACEAEEEAVTTAPDPVHEAGRVVRIDFSYRFITDERLAGMVANGEIPKDVTYLDLSGNQITDLSPLIGLTGLTELNLGANQITDLSPLSRLTGLTWLTLWDNQITDLSPLSGLTGLTGLGLDNNQITDLSPLSGLTGLTHLTLDDNPITDFSPLGGLDISLLHTD